MWRCAAPCTKTSTVGTATAPVMLSTACHISPISVCAMCCPAGHSFGGVSRVRCAGMGLGLVPPNPAIPMQPAAVCPGGPADRLHPATTALPKVGTCPAGRVLSLQISSCCMRTLASPHQHSAEHILTQLQAPYMRTCNVLTALRCTTSCALRGSRPKPAPLWKRQHMFCHALPACPCRMFRVVPAASLLQHFASDRSHMRCSDGSWCAEPPPYPCITAADGTRMNLGRYRNMTLDVLQDRVPCQHTAPCQHSGSQHAACDMQDSTSCQHRNMQASQAAAGAAAGEAVKHPCQPAAGMVGINTTTAAGASAGGAVSAVGAPDLADATQAPAVRPAVADGTCPAQVMDGHASSTNHMHVAAARAMAGGARPVDRLVTWVDVVGGSQNNPYGVVLHEVTLLRCLLAEVV